MRSRIIYTYNKNGVTKQYSSIQELANEIGVSRQCFYKHTKGFAPIKRQLFVGYDQDEVIRRAQSYWNTNTDKSIDSVQLMERIEKLEEIVESMKEDKQKIVIENKKLTERINQLEKNSVKPTRTQPVYAETQSKVEQRPSKPQPKPQKRVESVPKPVYAQPQTSVKNTEKKTDSFDFDAFRNQFREQDTKRNIEYEQEKEAKKRAEEEAKRKAKEERYKVRHNKPKYPIGNPTCPENYSIWYKSPIDGNYHFNYSAGFDLQQEWEVTERKPYFYAVTGELLDYRNIETDANTKEWYEQAIDPVNGCEAWLRERDKFFEKFGKSIDPVRHEMLTRRGTRSFEVLQKADFPTPVYEDTAEEGVKKVYDLSEFVYGRLYYTKPYGQAFSSELCYKHDIYSYIVYQKKCELGEPFNIDNVASKRDLKLLDSGNMTTAYRVTPVPNGELTDKDIKNAEVEKEIEEEVER